MRAIRFAAPWGLDSIEIVDVPVPVPGPGEVRLRMTAISLNYRDLLIASGKHLRGALSAAEPVTPFGDGCGIVDAIGPGVTRFAVGDRLVPMMLPRWQSGPASAEKLGSALGMNVPGVGREYAVFGEAALAPAPASLADAEAACLACAGLTAWSALFGGQRLAPGATALLQGTGGVATFALQFAKAAGIETIVTSSSDAKLAQARAIGADHGINYRAEPAWATPARAITAGRGADLILEMGGDGTLAESLRAIRTGGQIAVVGMLGSAAPLEPAQLLASAAELRVVTIGSRDTFVEMCRAIDLHAIRPIIGQTYHWTEAREALRALQAQAQVGKIVLTF